MENRRKLTPLRAVPKTIDAACYNQVRLALRRLGDPLRVKLARHRGLAMILTDDCWTCVDSLNDDLTIMEWVAFAGHRSGLHDPVNCQLRLYHLHAGLIMGTVLEDLEQVLQHRHDLHPGDGSAHN